MNAQPKSIPLSVFEKYKRLQDLLRELDGLIVAYSGGVDSALVVKVAYDVLGAKAVAVTADSPALPRGELALAERMARQIGVRHLVVQTQEMNDPDYARNPANRCYFCKSHLYARLQEIGQQLAIRSIANGTNLDDLGDYRPGLQAAEEFRVISPLKEAGLTKEDVRALAKHLGLPIWEKPASPCLSSRIPYGSAVTAEKLAMIEAAESYLKSLEISELRVRHFGLKARVEVNPSDFGRVTEHLSSIRQKFIGIGFTHVEIHEFRSGSLNAALNTAT